MKNPLRVTAAIIVALGFVAWAIHVLLTQWEQLPAIHLDPWLVIAVAALALGVVAMNSVIVEFSAKRIGGGVGPIKSQTVGCMVTLLNYVLPFRAGLAARLGFYVHVGRHDAITLAAVLLVATAISQAVAAVVFLLVVASVGANDDFAALFFAAIAVLIMMVGIWFVTGRSWSPFGGRIGDYASRFSLGFRALLKDRGYSLALLAIFALMVLALTGARYGMEAMLAQHRISIGAALAMASAAGVSSLVGIAFGGLGVREAAVVIAGKLFGLPSELCLMIALTDRVLVTATLVAFGIPAALASKRWL